MRRVWLLLVAALLFLSGSVAAARERLAQDSASPVYYIGTTQKAMALTFDVSWGESMLPKVLDILRRYDQTATFFLSGPWARTHAGLVRDILAGGNEIASHGQRHINLSGVSTAGIADNIGAADAVLRAYTERPLRFFRPPNGDFNGRVVEAARGLGYETIIWSVDSRDWMNPGVADIVSRVERDAFPGAILLFHASDTCKQTDLALPAVITGLRAQGYRLVTLGDLWSMGPPVRQDPRGSGTKPNTQTVTPQGVAGGGFACPKPPRPAG